MEKELNIYYTKRLIELFDEEKSLNKEVLSALNKSRLCENCKFDCCRHPIRLRLSYIEMRLLIDKFPEIDIEKFIFFIQEKIVEDKQLCPNLILPEDKCAIYEFRPFSCRFFGLLPHTPFPEKCDYSLIPDKFRDSAAALNAKLLDFNMQFYNFMIDQSIEPVTDFDRLFIANILCDRGRQKESVEILEKIVDAHPWDNSALNLLNLINSELENKNRR